MSERKEKFEKMLPTHHGKGEGAKRAFNRYSGLYKAGLFICQRGNFSHMGCKGDDCIKKGE